MATPHAPQPAPRRRKSPAFVAGLAVGWLLLVAWGALVAWNASTSGASASLARLIALPPLPGLPPNLAAQTATTLAALAPLLLVVLGALTLVPLPAPQTKPTLQAVAPAEAAPAEAAPAEVAPAEVAPADNAPRSPLPLGGARAAGSDHPGAQRAQSVAEGPGVRAAPAAETERRRKLFISHSSGDDDFGHALADWLRGELGAGWVVFYDSHGAGSPQADDHIVAATSWLETIQREVMACDVFVVIETQAAMSSYWVQREIQLAWTRKPGASVESGLVVAPVLREACDLPPLLSLVQFVDYRAGADEAQARAALLAAIQSPRTRPAPLVEVGPPFDLGQLRPADRFIGREDDVQWVIERLTAQGDDPVANIAAANGQGGIGKTALAAEAVRRLMAGLAFRDGVAALDCRDKHTEGDALALLRDTLARFTDGRRRPDDDDPAALGNLARGLFAGKRALVVLDNVEADLPAETLIAPLRAAGAALLLTSRAPIDSLPIAASRKLDLLPLEDALTLFSDTYGRALSDAELASARRIVVALGRHTLAVKLAAAYAATQNRWLSALAHDFERNPLRDAWLEKRDNSQAAVAYTLKTSVAAMSPGGQRLFAALGAAATADIGRMATLALAEALGDDESEAERSLRWIVDLRLADPAEIELPGGDNADRERLRLHPLTQAWAHDLYAGRRALPHAAHWDDAQRERVARPLATWYADYTNTAPDLALTPDEANIIGALEWALTHGDDRAAASIANGMMGFWRDTGRTRAGLRYLPLGAAAAGRIAAATGERGDIRGQANITAYLGDILQHTGRLDEAEAIFRQDLDLRRSIEDRRGEGVVLSRLGRVALSRGRLEEAADYFAQSLPIHRETQYRQGEGVVLSNLGQVALRRGRLEEAADYFAQSLPIRRETQDRRGEGVDLSNLGEVALRRGRLEEAADYFAQSLPIHRETQDRQGEGAVLYYLALIAEDRDDLDMAERLHRESLALSVETQEATDIATSLEVLGRFLIEHGRGRDEGCGMLAEAIALWREIGLEDREQEAREEARELGCAG